MRTSRRNSRGRPLPPSLHLYSIRFNPSFHQTFIFGSLFISILSVAIVLICGQLIFSGCPKTGTGFSPIEGQGQNPFLRTSFLRNLVFSSITPCALYPFSHWLTQLSEIPDPHFRKFSRKDLSSRLPRAADAFKVPSLPNDCLFTGKTQRTTLTDLFLLNI